YDRNPEVAQGLRGLLARGADAEAFAADHDIAADDVAREFRSHGFEAMLRELLDGFADRVTRREQVGVDAIAEHPGTAGEHCRGGAHAAARVGRKSRGSPIVPRMAEAATVYGEAR